MAVWPTTRVPAGIDTAGFIPEIWSKKILEAVHSRLVVVPLVNHAWEAELRRGDTINVGITNTVIATPITIGAESNKLDHMTGAKVPIIVDLYYEAPVAIEYPARYQSQINAETSAQRESGYAVAKKMDSSLCALFAALGSSVLGTIGSAISDDVLIKAMETLDEADVPDENRAWIFPPSARADIMKIDKFVRSDYGYGDVIPNGAFRKDIYGAPLYITNNLAAVGGGGNYGVYMHKEALAFIGQENSKVDRVEQPLKHQIVINTTALWGIKEMRNLFGVPIYTRGT